MYSSILFSTIIKSILIYVLALILSKLIGIKIISQMNFFDFITGVSVGSMIAKIIVHMPTKKDAVAKMLRALKEFEIKGVKTNREFLVDLLQDQHFLDGDFNNLYVENHFLKEWVKHHDK